MNSFSKLVGSALVTIFCSTSMAAQTTRVGTFDKTAVTVAFYRSPLWADTLKQKQLEMEQAKKTNDTKKVEELEHWGGSAQEMAHKQLMGEASIANILEALGPAFPEIAAKARVAVIVSDLAYADNTIQTVDITEFLLGWLKADAQTRKLIRELPKTGHPSP